MDAGINIWSQKLGILPVNFLHNQSEEQQVYSLLDGAKNNFCLGFEYDCDSKQMMNNIWSASMSNLVLVRGNDVLLYNVKNVDKPQSITYASVLRDIKTFKNYLGSISLNDEETIIPFIMNQFYEIRSALMEEDAAANSLTIFLYIISQLDNNNYYWKLPLNIDQAIKSIKSSYLLDDVIERLKGGTSSGLIPNVEMILRHCAGHLFQEANYMAQFNPQLNLFGGLDFQVTRNQRQVGSYFTPLYIARSIVEESLNLIDAFSKEELVIFDPACGSGVFLVEALRQLRSKNYQGKITVIGWDIDPLAIAMADFVLQYESSEWGKDKLSFKNEQKDSLDYYSEWPHADVIFMNPPYISWSMMTNAQREQVIAIIGNTNTNRPNLAALFYLLASQSLADGGSIGSLMPSSFLTADSSKDIRKKSNNYVRPTLICNLGGFVFTSVMADVSIVIATNKEENPNVQMVWTKNRDEVASIALQELRKSNETGIGRIATSDYNIYYARYDELSETDTWKCLSKDSYILKLRMASLLNSEAFKAASDIFDIKQGARTGANAVFVISFEEYQKLPKSERKYFRPSVDNASINEGRLTKTNYLFFPYENESLLLVDEDSLIKEIPVFYKSKLLPQQAKLSNRSEIDQDKWWTLTRPRNWQFDKFPKLVSTEFGKSGSFAFDAEGDFVVERGLFWKPLNSEFEEDNYYRYLAVMNSSFFDKLLELFSNELIGGVYNLETKYMKNIPLPLFDQMEEDTLSLLYDYGKMMSFGKSINKDLLNKAILRIYGER